MFVSTQLTRPPRSTHEVLEWSNSLVSPAMHSVVGTLTPPIRNIAGYHLGWHDERGRPITAASGKAIRPMLALLSAETVGGSANDAVPAAVAVELAHNFSLIHDDVMDGDATRRHRPTVWRVFGLGEAILAGDALLALAHEVLATVPLPASNTAVRWLATAMQSLVRGQQADLSFERRTDVGLAECLAMAEDKTAALIETSCALGALFGGADPERVAQLREFGHQLGVVFQLVDDLLGVWGEPATTGKPAGSDLRSRKKSLPVVAALESDSPAGRELAALYYQDDPMSADEITRAAMLIEHAGGRDWAEREAETRLTRAMELLRAAGPDEGPAAELAALARLISHRDR